MIIVDTNIICYLFIKSHYSELAESLFQFDNQWHVPSLWRSEFRNVLALYLRQNILTLDAIIQIQQQAEMLLRENEHTISSAEVLQLIANSDCSAYDCEFVALAQSFSVPLITMDKKVLKQFPDTAISLKKYI